MPNCPVCKLTANDEISCTKCRKTFHWNCTNLTDYEKKLHKNNPYKPWRCKICVDKFCIKCNKTFPISNNYSISCDKCNFWYHISCSGLEMAEFQYFHNNPTSKWNCKSCREKTCKKCKLNTAFKKSIKCNICDCKFHLKCAGFKQKSVESNLWNCRDCYANIFPFHTIDNKSLIVLHQSYPIKYAVNSVRNNKFIDTCRICTKKLNKHATGIPCTECKSLIHVKCTNVKDISKVYHTFKGTWQCKLCLSEKFPFSDMDNNILNELSYNSNLKRRKFISSTMISTKLKRLLSTSKNNAWYSPVDDSESFDIDSEKSNHLNSIKPNFMYYEVEKFQHMQKVWSKNKKLGVFHTNICSLQANVEKLEDLLVDLEYEFDVIALTETWNPEISKDKFTPKKIDGYHDYYGTTGSSRKGGCGFYIKNDLMPIPRNDLEFKISITGEETESCWFELMNNEKKEKNIIIGVVYRHPSINDSLFFDYLSKTLSKANKENKRIIICGDFNYDLLNYDNDDKVSHFLNYMLEQNLQPTILEPSRITNTNKPSLVDNIFTNVFDDPSSGNILEHISYDHLPNFMILDKHITVKDKIQMVRDNKNFDSEHFNNELLDPNLILHLHNAIDANHAYEIYHNRFIELLNKHAPMRKLSKKEIKLKKKPWLTMGLLKSISKKRALYSKFRNDKLKNKNTELSFGQYKDYNDLLNKLKRKSKRNFYHKYFTDNSSNSKNMWKGINQLLNRKKSKQKDIFLEENDGIISDSFTVANKFNKYFTSIADTLNSKIIKKSSKFQDYLKNPQASNFNFKETAPDEIVKILKSISVKKSCDIYDISPIFLKQAAQPIAQLIAILFNRSIQDGIFPEKLKTAKVIPLHKGGSSLSLSNYRPISLLPIFSKIFEKLAYYRIIEFIERHNILSKNQFGFQKNKSTELAVSSIVSRISKANENKKSSYCIFLDFAKAFDTVNHNILLEKLKYYGFRNQEFSWLESYLTNRTQFTKVGEEMSEIGYVKHGVPQGSVLGPLLFLLYINDISESSSILQFILFADDTTVYYSDQNNDNAEKVLNIELRKVSNWLAANKLSLNVGKSNFLHFHYGKSLKREINIQINDAKVEEKSSTKYLGTIIDNKLSWKAHIEYIRTKLSKSIGIISKVKHFATESVLLNLYYSFIQSHINYNLLNWSVTSDTNLNPIRMSVKKIIRIITFNNRYEHTEPLFHKLGILTLDLQIKHRQALFMWKLSNNYVPPPISELFDKNRYNTNRYNLPHSNKGLIYANVKVWNNEVPLHFKRISIYKSFNKKYKEHLLLKI